MLKRFFMMIFVCLFSLNIYAISFDEVVNLLKDREQNISNLSFSFTQNISSKGEKSSVSGKLMFKKPNKFVVENMKPVKQKIITNGEKVWIYNPSRKQVAIGNASYIFGQDNFMHFFGFIFNFEEWQKNYECSFVFEEKDVYALSMKSKKRKNLIVNLKISKQDVFPREIELKMEDLVVVTKIDKLDTKTELLDSNFEFNIPKKIEVWNMEDK
jgi:chaperone LolA